MTAIEGRLIHRDYWNDHRVEIIDNGDYRSLYFGSNFLQSRMSLSNPHALILTYTHFMVFGLLFHREPKSILLVGVGSGSLVRYLHHFLPNSRIDAVDYSPHIIKLAKGYFCLPQSPLVTIHCSDGYAFLQENGTRQYDFILIDAFDGMGMAPTVYHRSFFNLCSQVLSDKGVGSFNLWSSDRRKFREIKNDLRTTFDGSLILPVPERGNVVALTANSPFPTDTLYCPQKDLTLLSQKYRVNFSKMVKIARNNNVKIGEKVKRMFG